MPSSLPPQSRASSIIRHSPIPVIRRLSINETEEAVTLSGTVDCFYHKQLAQEALRPVLEGRRLYNRVVVVR